jgi:Pyruvate/2-oxoacid:ferredoxin oxidoreductase delta subunit
VTLLDGILAMEGPGPGKGGSPRPLGVIMASSDAFCLDAVVCRMLGVRRDDLPTNRVAARAGLLPDDVAIDGELPPVTDLRLPGTAPLVFGPRPLHRFIRKHLLQRPVCDAERCRHCGECWAYCPAQAITRETHGLSFDYDACIRCYCCVEVCPHAALEARETTAGRMVRRLLR